MKKSLYSFAAALMLSASLHAYDAHKAELNEKFYANFTHKACADSKLFIDAEDVMKLINEGKGYLILDVRTKGEASVLAVNDKNSMHIELEHLFKKENLDKLPTDVTIISTCHSGTRGTLAAIGLKQIGFKNVRVMKKGLIGLAEANTAKNAPMR